MLTTMYVSQCITLVSLDGAVDCRSTSLQHGLVQMLPLAVYYLSDLMPFFFPQNSLDSEPPYSGKLITHEFN